ncbi:MAG: Slp family lipoprotein [Granulosicoccus sp.]|nr:Slp family lipoprotein [Granulosicoccus sp.]
MKPLTDADWFTSGNKCSYVKITAGVLILLCCSACVTSQSAQRDYEVEKRTISVTEARENELLFADDGKVEQSSLSGAANIRWGGTIARLENVADQITEVEVVSRPLRGNGRPLHNDQSEGRFIAVFERFLDPQIVTVGRDITVVGSLSGRKEGRVGDSSYVFPLVAVKEFTYWKKLRPQRHFPHWNERRYWYDDPFWPSWHIFHPYRRPYRYYR